jgi:acetyl esterase
MPVAVYGKCCSFSPSWINLHPTNKIRQFGHVNIMKRKLSAFILIYSVMLCNQLSAQSEPNPDSLPGAQSHTYKSVNGIDLKLHIFTPESDNDESKAAVVFFFGGGWLQGSVSQFVPHSQHLASRGVVSIVADYRVWNRHHSNVMSAVADAKSAIRWLRSHAEELGIDPNRLAAGGGSAGGHLAVATAVVPYFDEPDEDHRISSSPSLLLLFNPAVDTSQIGQRREDQFQGQGENLSPQHQLVDSSVPTFIVHGKADTTVPFSHALAYCDKLKGLSGTCELHGYEEATHGFFNKGRENDRWYTPTVREMDRFLIRFGYMSEYR